MDDAARIQSKDVPGRPQELLEAISEKDAQEVRSLWNTRGRAPDVS